jgi:hypothetical protein
LVAPIAQLDRASDYGSEGYRFNSYWVRQFSLAIKRLRGIGDFSIFGFDTAFGYWLGKMSPKEAAADAASAACHQRRFDPATER